MLSDGELLRRYADHRSEAAFTELVQRHINIVYRAALRRVGGDAHSADDVTQRVFTDLARKAESLQGRPNLAGWLYTGTRFAAAEVVRAEQRRRNHEREAHAMHQIDSAPSVPAARLDPFLDEIMDLLPAGDREAILLHFFEGHSFVEVGALLSLSADAARMRVNRALDRLRTGFEQHGVTSTASALGVALASQSALAAPALLVRTVASHALSHAGMGAVSTGIFGAVLHALKIPPIVAGIGAATSVALLSWVVAFRHTAESTSTVVEKPNPSAELAAFNAIGASPAQEAIEVSATPPVSTARDSSAVTNGAGQNYTGDFSLLSSEEKNLLAMLWTGQKNAGPKARVGLKVGPQAPNFPGIDPLVTKGWVESGNDTGLIRLTPAGLVFAAGHGSEIEAYPVTTNRLNQREFTDLSPAGKTLLKMLWRQLNATTPAPGLRIGLKLRPDSPILAAYDPLVAKGWAAIAPRNGMIYLTPAGRLFCSTHQAALRSP